MPAKVRRVCSLITALIFGLITAVLPIACRSENETAMFRGDPQHTGVYLTEGIEEAPSVLWKFATGGRVLSSPAVVDGVAYIGSDDGSLYAVATETGDELWGFGTGGAVRS